MAQGNITDGYRTDWQPVAKADSKCVIATCHTHHVSDQQCQHMSEFWGASARVIAGRTTDHSEALHETRKMGRCRAKEVAAWLRRDEKAYAIMNSSSSEPVIKSISIRIGQHLSMLSGTSWSALAQLQDTPRRTTPRALIPSWWSSLALC